MTLYPRIAQYDRRKRASSSSSSEKSNKSMRLTMRCNATQQHRAEQALLHSCVEDLKRSVKVVMLPEAAAEEAEFRDVMKGPTPTPLRGNSTGGGGGDKQTGAAAAGGDGGAGTEESMTEFVMRMCVVQ